MAISPSTTNLISLVLQGATVPLAGFSAYYIWRQLKALALTIQSSVSENLASQSMDILKHIAAGPGVYEYFYENKPLKEAGPNRTYLLCSAEIMANFMEHVILQLETLPPSSRDAWMRYVRDHYHASIVVRDFIAQHRPWYADVFLDYVAACSKCSAANCDPSDGEGTPSDGSRPSGVEI